MPREQPEQGVRKTHSARYRITCPPAKGLDDSHDPSTPPDEALVEGVNARAHDGIIVSRGGQQKATTALTGKVMGMVEIESASSACMLLVLTNQDSNKSDFIWTWDGLNWKSSPLHTSTGWWGYQNPSLISIRGETYAIQQDWDPLTGPEGGWSRSHLARLQPPEEAPTTSIEPGPPVVMGVGSKLQANTLCAYNLLEFLDAEGAPSYEFVQRIIALSYGDPESDDVRDAIFVSTARGAIHVYDRVKGLRVIQPELTPYPEYGLIEVLSQPPTMFVYRQTLYAAFGSIVSFIVPDEWVVPCIQKYNFWAQGKTLDDASWTALALPVAGYPDGIVDPQTFFLEGAVYEDALYIGFTSSPLGEAHTVGYSGFVKVEDDVVTLAHIIGTSFTMPPPPGYTKPVSTIFSVASHKGCLYYSWYEVPQQPFSDFPTWGYYLGKFDGSFWNDYWKPIRVFQNPGDTAKWITAMASIGDLLYIADTDVSPSGVYTSTIYTLEGAGSVSLNLPSNFVVNQMLAY